MSQEKLRAGVRDCLSQLTFERSVPLLSVVTWLAGSLRVGSVPTASVGNSLDVIDNRSWRSAELADVAVSLQDLSSELPPAWLASGLA